LKKISLRTVFIVPCRYQVFVKSFNFGNSDVSGGTLPQKVSSCFEVLDGFMKQPYPIVASMVVADKIAGSGGSDNLTARIASIMGMSDITKLSEICQ